MSEWVRDISRDLEYKIIIINFQSLSMKAAATLLTFLVLAAVASATTVAATPYDSVYAWLTNIGFTMQAVFAYNACLAGTHILSFLYGDGGYSFYKCL